MKEQDETNFWNAESAHLFFWQLGVNLLVAILGVVLISATTNIN
jgi:hypothetical protein